MNEYCTNQGTNVFISSFCKMIPVMHVQRSMYGKTSFARHIRSLNVNPTILKFSRKHRELFRQITYIIPSCIRCIPLRSYFIIEPAYLSREFNLYSTMCKFKYMHVHIYMFILPLSYFSSRWQPRWKNYSRTFGVPAMGREEPYFSTVCQRSSQTRRRAQHPSRKLKEYDT